MNDAADDAAQHLWVHKNRNQQIAAERAALLLELEKVMRHEPRIQAEVHRLNLALLDLLHRERLLNTSTSARWPNGSEPPAPV